MDLEATIDSTFLMSHFIIRGFGTPFRFDQIKETNERVYMYI